MSNITIDHDTIRQWVEARGGRPARVRQTGGSGDPGVIRIDMPGYSGQDSLEPISWEEFFDKFEENHLAFVYQDTTAAGQRSHFNKLVDRQEAHR
jgi:hypothetical protein